MDVTGASFDGFIAGGSGAQGQEVWFRMRCNGSEEMTFIAEFQKIDQAIAALATFSKLASDDRTKANPLSAVAHQKAGIFDISYFRMGEPFDPQQVAFQVETTIGATLQFALSKEGALRLAEELQKVASKGQQSTTRQ